MPSSFPQKQAEALMAKCEGSFALTLGISSSLTTPANSLDEPHIRRARKMSSEENTPRMKCPLRGTNHMLIVLKQTQNRHLRGPTERARQNAQLASPAMRGLGPYCPIITSPCDPKHWRSLQPMKLQQPSPKKQCPICVRLA